MDSWSSTIWWSPTLEMVRYDNIFLVIHPQILLLFKRFCSDLWAIKGGFLLFFGWSLKTLLSDITTDNCTKRNVASEMAFAHKTLYYQFVRSMNFYQAKPYRVHFTDFSRFYGHIFLAKFRFAFFEKFVHFFRVKLSFRIDVNF